MRWAIVAVVVALTAVVAVNAALLVYGGDRHDPVGKLSPVANVEQLRPRHPQPVPQAPAGETEHEDD